MYGAERSLGWFQLKVELAFANSLLDRAERSVSGLLDRRLVQLGAFVEPGRYAGGWLYSGIPEPIRRILFRKGRAKEESAVDLHLHGWWSTAAPAQEYCSLFEHAEPEELLGSGAAQLYYSSVSSVAGWRSHLQDCVRQFYQTESDGARQCRFLRPT